MSSWLLNVSKHCLTSFPWQCKLHSSSLKCGVLLKRALRDEQCAGEIRCSRIKVSIEQPSGKSVALVPDKLGSMDRYGMVGIPIKNGEYPSSEFSGYVALKGASVYDNLDVAIDLTQRNAKPTPSTRIPVE